MTDATAGWLIKWKPCGDIKWPFTNIPKLILKYGRVKKYPFVIL
jgi:hypothetical protein